MMSWNPACDNLAMEPHPCVLIAAVAASAHLSGVTRHAANLVRCLLLRPDVRSVHLAIAPSQAPALRSVLPEADCRLTIHEVQSGAGVVSRNLWYYNALPRMAASLKANVVHYAYPAPLRAGAFQCSTVVTLHDLYPYDIPANFGFPRMLFNRAILQQCLRACDAIACVSNSTMRRLDIYAPRLAIQKAVTIYNCVDPALPPASTCPLEDLAGVPFVLCVAQHRRNKNVPLTIRIFQRLLRERVIVAETKLVIVGIDGPETSHIRRLIRTAGLEQQVRLLRGIPDASLHWCYAHCELLLAPSVIEGFGLPVVEAMLHHCRIVCSDIPAFREVGGSYCEYAALDGDTEAAFIEAARAALSRHRFLAFATDGFSSTRIADAYLQLYQRLLAGSAKASSGHNVRRQPVLERGLHDIS